MRHSEDNWKNPLSPISLFSPGICQHLLMGAADETDRKIRFITLSLTPQPPSLLVILCQQKSFAQEEGDK